MSSRERGILIGLAIVLMAGMAFMIWRAREDGVVTGTPGGPASGGAWDTSRLPKLGPVLREETTPGGVVVQVLREGEGAPVAPDQAMDVKYQGYSPVSGAMFDRGVKQGLVLERGGVIDGWIEGLRGIRVREKRRLLIPAAMAYGEQPVGNIAANSDLAFDVEWVRLEKKDMRVGSGKEARSGARVLVHYKGTLKDGTVFDSSYERGEPIWLELRRGKVIPGWVHGIPGMRVGGVRKLEIPSHLAYGARATGKIPAHSDLDFVVELVGVE